MTFAIGKAVIECNMSQKQIVTNPICQYQIRVHFQNIMFGIGKAVTECNMSLNQIVTESDSHKIL